MISVLKASILEAPQAAEEVLIVNCSLLSLLSNTSITVHHTIIAPR